MRLIPSDPDVQTLVGRIHDGLIDLQPDFQRGVVWPESKRRALVDSILRDWHVPPVHLVREDDDERQIVLDGHQRLASIYDFARNELRVDGHTEPRDGDIEKLHGLRYQELPDKYKRRFDRFTIRVFTIIDYSPEEPYELFFRLNQPSVLTSSEKRNAFFGPARSQIRELVDLAIEAGLNRDRVGFSNVRLAYDDAIARFCMMLERQEIRHRITSWMITEKYRSGEPFNKSVLKAAGSAIADFVALQCFDDGGIKLNKATFQSWLWFTANARSPRVSQASMSRFVDWFELARAMLKSGDESPLMPGSLLTSPKLVERALRLFNDRATARVTDVSSVLLRDAILWFSFLNLDDRAASEYHYGRLIMRFAEDDVSPRDFERQLTTFIDRVHWGGLQ